LVIRPEKLERLSVDTTQVLPKKSGDASAMIHIRLKQPILILFTSGLNRNYKENSIVSSLTGLKKNWQQHGRRNKLPMPMSELENTHSSFSIRSVAVSLTIHLE